MPFSLSLFRGQTAGGNGRTQGFCGPVSAPSAGVPGALLPDSGQLRTQVPAMCPAVRLARASTQKKQFSEKLGSVCHKIQLDREIIGELKNDLTERQYVGQRVRKH